MYEKSEFLNLQFDLVGIDQVILYTFYFIKCDPLCENQPYARGA